MTGQNGLSHADTAAYQPDFTGLSVSLWISEGAYKLVCAIERLLNRA